tara:strand:- start:239 stop:487 length:249 start_codon:yes stop_codon:yes gene_type:complete
MSKENRMKIKKIREAYFRATVRYSGLFKALAQRAKRSTAIEVDPSSSEVVLRNRIAESEEVTESLMFRAHITQPVLDYLKDK